jgi:4-hydroxy-tetrahydrodipicolinate reductase
MKVTLVGSQGKMGSLIKELLQKDQHVELIYAVDQEGANYKQLSDVPQSDVLIDFSHPNLIEEIIAYGLKYKTPLVIATTGHTDIQLEKIKQASLVLPIFMSANYSFGVEVISHVLREISKLLVPEFDVEIIEKHHHHKIDAPSGTSKHLAKTIISSIDSPLVMINGHQTKREKTDLAIHAVRGGSIVGDHTIVFAGPEETIEISHHAQSRSIFAYGAIKAMFWIVNQDNGFYQMKDLLKELLS